MDLRKPKLMMRASRKRGSRSQATAGLRALLLNLEDEVYERVMVRLAASLPAKFGYAIAVRRADFRLLLDKRLRKWVSDDLEKVLGDQLTPEGRTSVVREFFRQRSCEILDTMRLSKDPRSYMRLVEVRGMENVEAALEGGRGVIFCSAHFGRAENCNAVLGALGLPVTGIARWSFRPLHGGPRKRRLVPQRVGRDDLGHLVRPPIESRPEDVTVAARAALLLRRNEAIFTNLDVTVRSRDLERSVRLDFLNRTAIVLPGAVSIAKLTGAPMLMILMHRSADWRHQRLEISPPVPTEGDATSVLRQCLAFIEAAIRREPAQWRYWGTPHLLKLGLIPEDPARYQRTK
jgi:Kdo2-lipid IVA lauroyltransferase/acyltransferase